MEISSLNYATQTKIFSCKNIFILKKWFTTYLIQNTFCERFGYKIFTKFYFQANDEILTLYVDKMDRSAKNNLSAVGCTVVQKFLIMLYEISIIIL